MDDDQKQQREEEILLHEYDIVFQNILHNEKARNSYHNFYLTAFSILFVGILQLTQLRQQLYSYWPKWILLLPLVGIFSVGLITLWIQIRLRIILDRDATTFVEIHRIFSERYPAVKLAFKKYDSYFTSRFRLRFHRWLNVSFLSIQLTLVTMSISVAVGVFIITNFLLQSVLSFVITLIVGLFLLFWYESKMRKFSFQETVNDKSIIQSNLNL